MPTDDGLNDSRALDMPTDDGLNDSEALEAFFSYSRPLMNKLFRMRSLHFLTLSLPKTYRAAD